VFDRSRFSLWTLIVLTVLSTSCWTPPRSYGLTDGGLRPLPAAPRWEGPPPYSPRQGPEAMADVSTTQVPDPLTLQDAFLLALKANKDILVTDLGARADRAAIMGAEGEFDPTVFASISRGRSRLPLNTAPLSKVHQSEGFAEVGVRQRVITGTDVTLSASNDYVRDFTGTAAINPAYGPEVSLSVSQDLLKDFGIGINRTAISLAENRYEISTEDLRRTAIDTLFEVESAYWDLYFALQDLEVRRQQRARAERLVEVAQAQVDAGISAPLDVVRARSSAAAQEVSILNAQNRVTQLRRRLLRAMGIINADLANQDFALAQAPPEELRDFTMEEAVEAALKARPDYVQALLRVDSQNLLMRFFSNQRLPRLQLFGEYLLSGLGNDLGTASTQVGQGDFNSWVMGLRFEFPIPNRTARSDYEVARLQHEQALWQWRSVYERIVREVGDALDDLRTAEARIKTAQESRRLAQDVLRAEEKSFRLGRSDSLDVLVAQEALATAERDEARARADYVIALANLFRAQGTLLEEKGVALREDSRRPARKENAE